MAFAVRFQHQALGARDRADRGCGGVLPLLFRFQDQGSAPRTTGRNSRGQNEGGSPQAIQFTHHPLLPSATTGLDRTPT